MGEAARALLTNPEAARRTEPGGTGRARRGARRLTRCPSTDGLASRRPRGGLAAADQEPSERPSRGHGSRVSRLGCPLVVRDRRAHRARAQDHGAGRVPGGRAGLRPGHRPRQGSCSGRRACRGPCRRRAPSGRARMADAVRRRGHRGRAEPLSDRTRSLPTETSTPSTRAWRATSRQAPTTSAHRCRPHGPERCRCRCPHGASRSPRSPGTRPKRRVTRPRPRRPGGPATSRGARPGSRSQG